MSDFVYWRMLRLCSSGTQRPSIVRRHDMVRTFLKRAVVISMLTIIVFAAGPNFTHQPMAEAKAPTWVPAEYADRAKIERSEQIFRVSWGIGIDRGGLQAEPIK
jgi:hypothetical protein